MSNSIEEKKLEEFNERWPNLLALYFVIGSKGERYADVKEEVKRFMVVALQESYDQGYAKKSDDMFKEGQASVKSPYAKDIEKIAYEQGVKEERERLMELALRWKKQKALRFPEYIKGINHCGDTLRYHLRHPEPSPSQPKSNGTRP